MAEGDDIQERMIEFAVRIIKLCSTLPKSPVGKHIANQLLRSGTSPAPNYGEARGAEIAGDFVHKLGIVFKELNETNIWLEIIPRSGLIAAEKIQDIRNECFELSKIISSSIKTVGKKNRPRYFQVQNQLTIINYQLIIKNFSLVLQIISHVR